MADIKAHINALPAANHNKRTDWLAGLSQFIASHDFYELVKDSAAARQIRSLKIPLPEVVAKSITAQLLPLNIRLKTCNKS